MKFGKNIRKQVIPSWDRSYLDYQGLKEKIKLFKDQQRNAPPLAGILHGLVLEIGRVEEVYSYVYSSIWHEASSISMNSHIISQTDWNSADRYELCACLELMFQVHVDLEDLRSFGVLNSRGFQRLLEKLGSVDPKPHGEIFDLINSKFSAAQFSDSAQILYDLGRLRDSITAISNILSGNLALSKRSVLINQFFAHSTAGLKQIHTAIQQDKDVHLESPFGDDFEEDSQSESATLNLLTSLIHLSIIHGSASSLKSLVKLKRAFMGKDDFTEDCLFPIITSTVALMGRREFFERNSSRMPSCICVPITRKQMNRNSGIKLLKGILEEFPPDSHIWHCASSKLTGRTLMYFVAKYGLLDVYKLLSDHVQDADDSHRSMFAQSIILEDSFGDSPLSLALASGFEGLFKQFLEFLKPHRSLADWNWKRSSGVALVNSITSVETNQRSLKSLLETDANIDWQKRSGETALYITACSGNKELVELLLSFSAATDKPENIKGWTPLIIASIEGHATIVELLLGAGADKEQKDHRGWTASDHAAYRGHMAICKLLGQWTNSAAPYYLPSKPPYQVQPFTELPRSRDESLIFVNLGSFNSNERIVPVEVYSYELIDDSRSGLSTGLSIQTSLIGRNEQWYTLDLPILEDLSNKPFAFQTDDVEKARLKFDIYRLSQTTKSTGVNEHVGSAVAILANLQKCLGPTRESLIREYQIPILSKESLESIGTVTFSLLIVKPFNQGVQNLPERGYFWEGSKRTKIVGHRGSGENSKTPQRLSLGENTRQSFLTAIEHGADWVELDVQVTKDHVPVVYHDFLVSETGTDAWIHDLNSEQFSFLSKSQSKNPMEKKALSRKARSNSLDSSVFDWPLILEERLHQTFDFKLKGFKGNFRGRCIQEPFLTLDELLSQTPDSVPLNVELKYPMLFEAGVEWESDIFAVEVNHFVDTILSTIISHPSSRRRPILLSSFSPEICILLSVKHNRFPILFLSESGTLPCGDTRASSVKEAVHFATSWGLDGIVTRSDPFVFAPILIQHAKKKGLITASFGRLNGEPQYAKVQAKAGLDQIIVDSIGLIAGALDGVHEEV